VKIENAAQHLRIMMWGLQKYRANIREMGSLPESFLAQQWPWVFGDRCPLLALQDILDRYAKTEVLSGAEYHNMMVVLDRFIPEVKSACTFFQGDLTGEQRIPQGPPDIKVLAGWD